nr:MAG TPA: protein of unknown function (DUF4722) [Caudoviricetes sp.]
MIFRRKPDFSGFFYLLPQIFLPFQWYYLLTYYHLSGNI